MIAAGIVVAALILAAGWWLNERRSEQTLNGCQRRRAVVTLKDSTSFAGVLWAVDKHCLVLRNASLIEDRAQTKVDGEVVVLRAEVSFVQLP